MFRPVLRALSHAGLGQLRVLLGNSFTLLELELPRLLAQRRPPSVFATLVLPRVLMPPPAGVIACTGRVFPEGKMCVQENFVWTGLRARVSHAGLGQLMCS